MQPTCRIGDTEIDYLLPPLWLLPNQLQRKELKELQNPTDKDSSRSCRDLKKSRSELLEWIQPLAIFKKSEKSANWPTSRWTVRTSIRRNKE